MAYGDPLTAEAEELLRGAVARYGVPANSHEWFSGLLASLDAARNGSLDAAWAEAEAAANASDGKWLRVEGPDDHPHGDWYTVEVLDWKNLGKPDAEIIVVAKEHGPLVAALRALAAQLRERAG